MPRGTYKPPPSAADYPEYVALVKEFVDASLSSPTGDGISDTIDPIAVLIAGRTPERVVEIAREAILAGCKVRFVLHSCHVGSWETVSFFAPLPQRIENELNAIDASGLRDYSFIHLGQKHRWSKDRSAWEWCMAL